MTLIKWKQGNSLLSNTRNWDQLLNDIFENPINKICEDWNPSVDIYEKGKNKAQVLDDIEGEVCFFGDKMDKGGNDYPIAERLIKENRKHSLFKVKSPQETWDILKNIN